MKHEIEAQTSSLGQGMVVGNPGQEPPGPEEAVSKRMTRSRILEALESLPEDYRTAVTLADLQGLSYKEIAEVMDCPIGTVMSRIYRGRKLLHKLLFDHALAEGLIEPEPRQETDAENEGAVSLADYRKKGRKKA
jgi:RNA polymerase sigma-70 factor (ECF subfamily)